LLAIGGDFCPERLLNAYAGGIFPWPVAEGEPITWFSPDPRFVLKAADLHIPKSLVKTLRKGLFEYRVDTAFPGLTVRFTRNISPASVRRRFPAPSIWRC
jgi:leucyl/phenylalanyl-tRNA--protein transferase